MLFILSSGNGRICFWLARWLLHTNAHENHCSSVCQVTSLVELVRQKVSSRHEITSEINTSIFSFSLLLLLKCKCTLCPERLQQHDDQRRSLGKNEPGMEMEPWLYFRHSTEAQQCQICRLCPLASKSPISTTQLYASSKPLSYISNEVTETCRLSRAGLGSLGSPASTAATAYAPYV